MIVTVKRVVNTDAPFELVENAGNDWTHFAHLHRKSHLTFRLLQKQGDREMFLYRARLIYPLPIYRTYLVFRKYAPEQNGYKQIYLDVKTGKTAFLDGIHEKQGDRTLGIGIFTFEASAIWKIFPKLFGWLFKLRMRKVRLEDNAWVRERTENGGYEVESCAPVVPEAFDFYEDAMKKGPPKTEFYYEFTSMDNVEDMPKYGKLSEARA